MFENITRFFRKFNKEEKKIATNSKVAAKERLHLVLMQDRANVSADFLELMKQEIIEVIKKYIDVDEKAIDVRLTNQDNGDGTTGAPALYANIPITNIKNEARKLEVNKVETDKENTKKNDGEKKENKTSHEKAGQKGNENKKVQGQEKNQNEVRKQVQDKNKNEVKKQVQDKDEAKKKVQDRNKDGIKTQGEESKGNQGIQKKENNNQNEEKSKSNEIKVKTNRKAGLKEHAQLRTKEKVKSEN